MTSTMHLVCAKSALAVPRTRAVADLILAEFSGMPGREGAPRLAGEQP